MLETWAQRRTHKWGGCVVPVIHFGQHLKHLPKSWKPDFIKHNNRWKARYLPLLAWLENRVCTWPSLYQSEAQAQMINQMLVTQEKRGFTESMLMRGSSNSSNWRKGCVAGVVALKGALSVHKEAVMGCHTYKKRVIKTIFTYKWYVCTIRKFYWIIKKNWNVYVYIFHIYVRIYIMYIRIRTYVTDMLSISYY